MTATEDDVEYVTARVGCQLVGLPISRVQDVFKPDRMTPVPLAAPEIAGVLNLRGRVVTAIDLGRRLHLADCPAGAPRMAIGIEFMGESYGLLIDAIGDVIRVSGRSREGNPVNIDPHLAGVSAGVHRLDGGLMMVLDVDRILQGGANSAPDRVRVPNLDAQHCEMIANKARLV